MNCETNESPIRSIIKTRVVAQVKGLTESRGCAQLDTLLDTFPNACQPIAIEVADELLLRGDISADGFTLKWTGSTGGAA